MKRDKSTLELDGERFRAMALSAFDMISEVDRSGRVTYVSPNHARLLGQEATEIAGQLGFDAVLEEDKAEVTAAFADLFGRGQSARSVFRTRDKQGRIRWIECTGTPLTTPDGETRALLLSREVTEQKQMEARLAASRERFQSIAENAYDMIAELDLEGRVLYANEATLRTLELEPDIRWTEEPMRMLHPDDQPAVDAAIETLRAGGEPTVRYRVRLGDGSLRWLESRYRMFVNSDGDTRVHVITRDITDSVESERRIQESEARYRELVENSPVGILVFQGSRVVFANAAGAHVCGALDSEHLVGTPLADILHPEDAVAIPRLIERVSQGGRVPALTEARIAGLDGETREIIATGSLIDYEGERAYQAIVRDVTGLRAAERERRRLELQLQEARKLESLGMLAGGIAHDFNNLLAVILANTRFARRQAANDEGIEALGDAIEAADQAARLTQQLLTYAGRRSPDVRATHLSLMAQSTSALFASILPQGVTLRTDFDPDLPSVRADVVQLEQVLMNLVMNAGDAMAGRTGEVRVSTGRQTVSSERISRWVVGADLAPGEYVFLEVADSGAGMDAETRARVFEPFFTTKRDGHGLGLAAVLGMVRGHHGGVELESETDRGTRFRVYLPSEPSARSDAGAAITLDLFESPALRDNLARLGLSTLAAGSLEAACDLLRRHGEEVELAICGEAAIDDARRITDRLREHAPGLPVLWLGPASDRTQHDLQAGGPAETVADTTNPTKLRAALESLLGKD